MFGLPHDCDCDFSRPSGVWPLPGPCRPRNHRPVIHIDQDTELQTRAKGHFYPVTISWHKLTKGVNEISRWFPQHSTWYWDAVFMPVYIMGLYSVLNIVKICVISFTAKAARWCQATAPPRWHVMVTDPCLVPTLCWCDTLTAALHLTSHEPVGYIYIYISTYLRFYISTLDNIVPLCWTVELPITVAAAAGDVDPCDTGPALRRSQDMVWIFERPVKSASPATCTRVLHWLSATQHQVRRHWPSAGAGAAPPPPATDPGSASAQGPIHTLHQGWSFRFLYKI